MGGSSANGLLLVEQQHILVSGGTIEDSPLLTKHLFLNGSLRVEHQQMTRYGKYTSKWLVAN